MRAKVDSKAFPMDSVRRPGWRSVSVAATHLSIAGFDITLPLAMMHEKHGPETTFGYFSTVQTAEHGYFGGYLIVSALGRPLEFHFTSPVRPSRAQEILYGPTMQPYLLGEQIGGTLLGAAKLTPRLLLTDQAAMLALRPQARVPLVLVLPRIDPGRAGMQSDAGVGSNAAAWSESCGERFSVGAHELRLAPGFDSEQDAVVELIGLMAHGVDLDEPFGRIHEAIREAQRIGGRMLEDHDQAA